MRATLVKRVESGARLQLDARASRKGRSAKMKFLDITRPLAADLAPWPGDTQFDYSLVGRIAEGSSVNLGRITTSLHSGTHADAFFHFDDRGLTIDRFAAERYSVRLRSWT